VLFKRRRWGFSTEQAKRLLYMYVMNAALSASTDVPESFFKSRRRGLLVSKLLTMKKASLRSIKLKYFNNDVDTVHNERVILSAGDKERHDDSLARCFYSGYCGPRVDSLAEPLRKNPGRSKCRSRRISQHDGREPTLK